MALEKWTSRDELPRGLRGPRLLFCFVNNISNIFFFIVYPLTLEVKYKLYRLNIDILNHCAGNKLTQLADYLLTTKKRNRRQ